MEAEEADAVVVEGIVVEVVEGIAVEVVATKVEAVVMGVATKEEVVVVVNRLQLRYKSLGKKEYNSRRYSGMLLKSHT